MKVRELAEQLVDQIKSGKLDPDAVVVRPFCMCDEEFGYVEVKFLDQVIRSWTAPDTDAHVKVYRYGDVPPGEGTTLTLKLG